MKKITEYTNIICDLDGTLLNDRKRHYECYLDILAKYGGNPVSEERYWNLKRGLVKRTVLLEESGFAGQYEDYAKEWVARIETKEYLTKEKLHSKAKEFLEYAKKNTHQNGGKLYLATLRHDRELLLWQLEQLEIRNCFDKIFSSNPLVKVDKKGLFQDIEITNGLVLGDSEADQELAEHVGADFIAITSGVREKSLLEADKYVEEICELLEEMER